MKPEKIAKCDILCLDIETTGLKKEFNEILQISIIDGNGTRRFSSRIKPSKRKRWPDAQAIHHISPDDVKNCPELKDVRNQLNDILKSAKLLVTYNGEGFDIPFLKHHGIKIPSKCKSFDVYTHFPGGNNGRRRLTDCAEYYGYTNFSEKAHDSDADTEATLYCFNCMMAAGQKDQKTDSGKAKQQHRPARIIHTLAIIIKVLLVVLTLFLLAKCVILLSTVLSIGFMTTIVDKLSFVSQALNVDTYRTYLIIVAVIWLLFLYRKEKRFGRLCVIDLIMLAVLTLLQK